MGQKSLHSLFSLLFAASILATPFIWAHTRSGSFAQTAAAAQARAEKDIRRIKPGKLIERELSGGQSHSYKITLEEGEYLNAVVEQRGIDVVVTLFGPDGKQILEVDSPNGDRGPEPFSLIVETAGDYRLSVRSLKKDAAAGRYEVKVIELREATDRDLALAEARDLLDEAASLQGQRKSSDAIPFVERALSLQENAVGAEHPIIAQSLNKLASLYNDKLDYAMAEQLYQRAIAIQEKALRPDHPDLADSLMNFAELHSNNRAYDKADPLYRRAIAIREKALGPEHLLVVVSLHKLAFMLHRNKGDYASAEPLYQRSLAILEKVQGPDSLNVAQMLTNLADLYYHKRDDARAEPLYQRALAIQEKVSGPDHPDVVTALNNLARMYSEKGEYAKVVPLYQRRLAIHEKSLGPEHSDVAYSLNNLAQMYTNTGDYARAEPLFQRALAIQEKSQGPEDPTLADFLNNFAYLYSEKGDYERAESLYQRGLSIYEKRYSPESSFVAKFLNNLAAVYRRKGDYDRAEQFYQRALVIEEKVLGPDSDSVANTLNNLAFLYSHRGDYARAEPLYQRALTIWEKYRGPDHPLVATALGNLASLYGDKGDYDRAEPLYQRALAIREKVQGPEHPDFAGALNNLANLYSSKGDNARAEPLLQRALAVGEKVLGPDHPDVATWLNNLASLYTDKGDYARAESLGRRALAIWEKALGPGHSDVATALNSLAGIYRSKGDYARAEQFYQRSLAILENDLGLDHPKVAISLNSLGTVYEATGKMEQAVAFHRQAAEVYELNLNRNLGAGSERQKLAYLETLSNQSSKIISLHIRSAPNDPAARDLAITTILRRKGRALDAMTDSIAALRRRATPEDQALLDQLKETRSQLARLALNGPQRTTPAEHRARLKNLEEQTEKLEADISSRYAEFRVLSQPVTTAAVQAAIPAGSALVEFFAYRPFNPKAKFGAAKTPPRYVVYVLRREGETRWVELGEAKAIDEAVKKLRQALRDPNRRDVKQLAREVDRLVMDPLRPLLTRSRRIFLSPDGALNLVPFAALVDKSGHYLVRNYEFSYLTSGRDLLRLQAPRQGSRSAMVVANPDFGESASLGAEGSRGIKLKYQPASGSGSSILSNAFFPSLPGTADEAKALKAMLPDVTVLTGAQATEAALKQADSPRILHIATHGFFLPDVAPVDEIRGLALSDDNPTFIRIENPLLRSGLALSSANQRKSGAGHDDDGVLTAEEASALDLWGTKLVVLSACDTGVGEVKNGDGVYGLRRALALAGAETQVMSLWPVSDKATRDLMIEYYKKLLGGSGRSEALREAQLRMLAGGARGSDGSSRILIEESEKSARPTTTGQAKDYSHPYYWACFIQSGEWKKLDLRETPSR